MLRKVCAAFFAFAVLSGLFNIKAADYRSNDTELLAYIEKLCEEYEVPVNLVRAVIEHESSWNAEAVNYNETCFGLMQVGMINFTDLNKKLGTDNLLDPYQNVRAGIYLLSGYIRDYIDYHMALMCYSCGEGRAKSIWEKGYFTTPYSRDIMERMGEMEWEELSSNREELYLLYAGNLEEDGLPGGGETKTDGERDPLFGEREESAYRDEGRPESGLTMNVLRACVYYYQENRQYIAQVIRDDWSFLDDADALKTGRELACEDYYKIMLTDGTGCTYSLIRLDGTREYLLSINDSGIIRYYGVLKT